MTRFRTFGGACRARVQADRRTFFVCACSAFADFGDASFFAGTLPLLLLYFLCVFCDLYFGSDGLYSTGLERGATLLSFAYK